MTKEALDRIRKAYSSGLKVQIWFNGYWKDFNVRDYSMYPDPFSENRQYRIVGSDYADIAEKLIADLEKENAKLEEKLEMGIALKDEEIGCIQTDFNTFKSKAKEVIKQLMKAIPYGGGKLATESYDKAEKFLKENA